MNHRFIFFVLSTTLLLTTPAESADVKKSISFQETLSITQEDWFPYQITVDPRGNMYVLSGKQTSFLTFDPSGRETSRRFIPKGQGPGEFNSFDPVITQDGRFLAADWPQRRLTLLDRDFKVVRMEKMGLYGDIFQVDSKGQRYFLAFKAGRTRDRNTVVLTKCSQAGDTVKEFASYEWGPRLMGGGSYEDDLYRTQLKYALDARDNLIYAFSNKYEIFVVSPRGDVLRVITRDVKPRRVGKADTDRLLPGPSEKSPYKYVVPGRVPPISGLFPLSDGQLLVVTFEKAEGEKSLAGDLFDENGRYVATVKVPRYYHWDFLLAPQKSMAVVLDDDFYAIESDAEEETFWVKRYKIIRE